MLLEMSFFLIKQICNVACVIGYVVLQRTCFDDDEEEKEVGRTMMKLLD